MAEVVIDKVRQFLGRMEVDIQTGRSVKPFLGLRIKEHFVGSSADFKPAECREFYFLSGCQNILNCLEKLSHKNSRHLAAEAELFEENFLERAAVHCVLIPKQLFDEFKIVRTNVCHDFPLISQDCTLFSEGFYHSGDGLISLFLRKLSIRALEQHVKRKALLPYISTILGFVKIKEFER